MLNFDMMRFYEKYLQDMKDDQVSVCVCVCCDAMG